MSRSVQCMECKHSKGSFSWSCKAFPWPQRIPSIISTGEFVHDVPYYDDHGFRYEYDVELFGEREDFEIDDEEYMPWQCDICKHRHEVYANLCKAYPEGIPDDVLRGCADHREPFEGDGGIIFEPDGSEEAKKYMKYFEDWEKNHGTM